MYIYINHALLTKVDDKVQLGGEIEVTSLWASSIPGVTKHYASYTSRNMPEIFPHSRMATCPEFPTITTENMKIHKPTTYISYCYVH